ncbi:MAG: histidinol dehydrogenase [Methanophagales archaeon]|nr:histidinol dehydrogenase [Methanophagales archaeon]
MIRIRTIKEALESKELEPESELELFSRNLDLSAVIPGVKETIAGVKKRGDAALLEYTEKFDRVRLKDKAIEVELEEIEAAKMSVDDDTFRSIEASATAIRNFHYRQKRRGAWLEEFSPGVFLGEKYVPFDVVGAYVPKGYFSSALMCVIPAKIAKVREIVVCTPPGKDGHADQVTLVAADLAGATRIFKIGGAQAIAALAFGTETVPRVQKVVGPGNIYVTAAKIALREEGIEIDFPAGPSEVLIIADETANPEFIAADMLAQAEHGESSQAVLLTDSERIAADVEREILATADGKRLKAKGEGNDEDISQLQSQYQHQHWILTGASIDECIEFANKYAPEHLEIIVRSPLEVLKSIKNAGSVFIGNYSPVAAGDYATGANHVLPTAGYAKLFSGLDVDHFMHRITLQWLDKEGLRQIKNVVVRSCKVEGMEAHARSVEKRFLHESQERQQ